MKKRLTAAFIAITLMFGTTTSIATEITEDYIDISESSDKFPNPRIEVGKKYQTYPSLVWDRVDGACGYDIWNKLEGRDEYSMAGATVNTSFEIRIGTSAPWVGKGMSSDSEIIKEVAIGARTEKCSGNAMIPPSQAAKLKCDINTKSKKGNKEYTAYRSELELFGEKYCVYTITGLPANHTAEFEYLVKGEDEWNYSHKVNEKREINSDGSFVFLAKENEMYDELCFKDREIDLKKDCFYISVFDSTVENNEVTEVTKTVYPVTINMKPNYTKTQEVSFEKNIPYNQPVSCIAGQSFTNKAKSNRGNAIIYNCNFSNVRVDLDGKVYMEDIKNENNYGEIFAIAPGTDEYPAAICMYRISFKDPNTAPPNNIRFEFDEKSTIPSLKWDSASKDPLSIYEFSTDNGETWEYSYDKGLNSYGIMSSEGNMMYFDEVSFDEKGNPIACDEVNINKVRVAKAKDSINNPTTEFAEEEISFTRNQLLSKDRLESNYLGKEKINGNDSYSFGIKGLPKNKTARFIYSHVSDGANYLLETCDIQINSDGEAKIYDEVNGIFNLSDLKVGKDDKYYIAIYDSEISELKRASSTITVYQVDFKFDNRKSQSLIWSDNLKDKGIVNVRYGTLFKGPTAINDTENGGLISYYSSDENVASVNALTGEVRIHKPGRTTITATAAATDDVVNGYITTSITYTLVVEKKTLSSSDFDISITNETFDGKVKFASITPKTSVSGIGDIIIKYNGSTTPPINAGTYNVTFDVYEGDNYKAASDIKAGTLVISKGSVPILEDIYKELIYSKTNELKLDIKSLLVDSLGCEFKVNEIQGDSSIISDITETEIGINVKLKSGMPGQKIIIPVEIKTNNYQDTKVNVIVKLVDKTRVNISGVIAKDKIYDGLSLQYDDSAIKFSTEYTGELEYIWNTADSKAPKNVGTYTLTVKIPDDNYEYMGEQIISDIRIMPKTLTIKPEDVVINKGDKLPSVFKLKTNGLIGNDVIKFNSKVEFILQDDNGIIVKDTNRIGKFMIKWANTQGVNLSNNNYDITLLDGIMTILEKVIVDVDDNGSSNVKIEVETKTDGDKTTAKVDSDTLNNAIDKAIEAIKNKGRANVKIIAPTPKDAKSIEVEIPKSSLFYFTKSKATNLTITSDIGEITISKNTAESILNQAGADDIKIKIGKVNTKELLNENQIKLVGNHPIYDFSVMCGEKYISEFEGGLMTINLPYVLKEGEDPSNIVIWYLDKNSNVETLQATYDATNKTVSFTTNHFSYYAIGYDKKDSKKVTDSDMAKTGDMSKTIVYIGILFIAGIVLVSTKKYKKQYKH